MTVQEWLGESNTLGVSIWEAKYRVQDETFEHWLDRVSSGNENVKRLIREKKFLFAGRILSNIGSKDGGSRHNCYSSGYAPDDYDGLLELNKQIGMTYKAQGGQGISLSMLRPKGTPIGSRYESDGIVPFMEIFNTTTEQTSQGGSRKGALMLSLDARHKEIETFIKIKSEKGRIEKANLSVELDDEFMNAVSTYYETGEEIVLHEHRQYSGHSIDYDVIPIRVYKMIIENAYDWGEPGCIFTNRFRNYNIMQYDDSYQIVTGNPCGEQSLPKYGSCCLGSINLAEYVLDPYTDESKLDLVSLCRDVDTAIEAMDDVITESYEYHPLEEQRELSYKYRNIGVGFMGYGTMLMKLGSKYGEKNTVEFTDYVFNKLFRSAVFASNRLAKSRGAYPAYNPIVFTSEIMRNHFTDDEIKYLKDGGLRNCSLLSIAPNGSLGSTLNVSGGVEPEFSIKYTRKTESLAGGEIKYFDVYCSAAQEYIKNTGNINLPDYFVCAGDIGWYDRINTQAAMQHHIDTAISSTVNLRHDIPIKDVELLYLEAWKAGLKGITIFRDGCKRMGILTVDSQKPEEEQSESTSDLENTTRYDTILPISRKAIGTTSGKTYCKKCACGTLYITVNRDNDGNIVESFVHTSKGGICQANTNAVNRMVSMALRSGVKVEEIVDQLKGIKCGACIALSAKGENIDGLSCPDIIARTITEFCKIESTPTPSVVKSNVVKTTENISKQACPECKSEIVNEGGCISCKNCGWSKCS